MTERRSTVDEKGNEKLRTSVHQAINNPDGTCNSYPTSPKFGGT